MAVRASCGEPWSSGEALRAAAGGSALAPDASESTRRCERRRRGSAGAGAGDAARGTTMLTPFGGEAASAGGGAASEVLCVLRWAHSRGDGRGDAKKDLRGDARKGAKVLRRGAAGASGAGLLALSAGADIRAEGRGAVLAGDAWNGVSGGKRKVLGLHTQRFKALRTAA